MDMAILRFFESIRNPFLDVFFSVVTTLGEETFFILIGIILFWCVDKRQGYFIMFTGFLGTIINQFLKLWFRVPRPWVRDESFTIVESARAEATGYSFPSGHTQMSVGTFGSIARARTEKIIRIIAIIICVLVPISRLYLGVHTPQDVLVSVVVALVLVFSLYPLLGIAMKSARNMRIFMCVSVALSVAFILFVELYAFPQDIDPHNYESGVKNGYKMLGCILGLWLTFELDKRVTKFSTEAALPVQILKIVLGLLPILAIKALLKDPLYAVIGYEGVADGVRYFLMAAFAGAIWPLTFKWFAKIKKGEKA